MLLTSGPKDPRVLDNYQRGKLGEFLVAADMACRGVNVAVSPIEGSPYDLIADMNGRMITVQVKSTLKPQLTKKNNKTSVMRYNFSMDLKASVDLMAFVIFDDYDILYMAACDVPGVKSGALKKRFGAVSFARQCEGSFERAVGKL